MNEPSRSEYFAPWRLFRVLTSFFAIVALTFGVALLPAAPSSATSRGPSASLGAAREVAHASGNTDFDGDWTVTDPANGDTATLHVTDQKDDGSFSGTLDPPGDAPESLSAPFTLENAQVNGRRFSFTIERTGIGGTGPDDRNATYTANWEGTITGNSATGSIDAKTVPGTVLNPNGFAGQRSFTAHRASAVSTSPSIGPVQGGVKVLVVGSGLDNAVNVNITDADGSVLATVPADGATASGFTFTAPDLTAAYHDANNSSVAASSKAISQLAVEVVPLDAQGAILSPPADYVISPPIVTSSSPTEVVVGGGQSISVAGKFFEGVSAVDFQETGSSTIVSAPVTVDSDTKLEFTSPDLKKFFGATIVPQKTLDMYLRIDVTQAFGSLIYSNSTPFVVDNLRVDSVSPAVGGVIGGDTVTVNGSGFSNVTEVDMTATTAPAGKAPRTLTIPVSPTNDRSFTFTAPDDTAYASGSPASTSYDIVAVATISGQRETTTTSSSDVYEYKGPEVTSTNIGSGSVSATSGAPITLTGKYFQGVTDVFLNTAGTSFHTTVTPSSVTATSITFTLPDLTKVLKGVGAKKATFDITVAIPAGGVGYNYIRSITGAASEITVKS
jgi:hypothetical protein